MNDCRSDPPRVLGSMSGTAADCTNGLGRWIYVAQNGRRCQEMATVENGRG